MIGRGSNIVLPDNPIDFRLIRFGGDLSFFGGIDPHWKDTLLKPPPGDLIQMERGILDLLRPLEVDEQGRGQPVCVFAWAGAALVSLSRETAYLGWSGLEFAAGIPGSVGGAVKMNAGAHGHELSEALAAVLLFSSRDGFCWRLRRELEIGYREGGIPGNCVVVAAIFKLYQGDVVDSKEKRRSSLDYRKRTQPLTFPSAGSVFRNPGVEIDGEIVSAGWLLERAELKGYRVGGVEFSKLHANWLVRIDDTARASDARELVDLGKSRVRDLFGVDLIEEIIFW